MMPSRSPRRSRRRAWAALKCGRSRFSTSSSAGASAPRIAAGVSASKTNVNRDSNGPVREMVEAVYRADSRRVLATLIRLLGDFDLAEEAMHDAFAAAVEQWPRDGVPAKPRAWLVSAARFKAIDGIRRRARFGPLEDAAERVDALADQTASWDDESLE